ncbi:transposase [Bradyrhizobium sp. CCBAU 51745]|nr:transposase [Bradyrhizobium sp. CCBAU 51745]
MPASGDTLLRMIRAVEFKPPEPLRVIGIDDWAWRKRQRYGTIICDLERNRVIDLLPDRNANTVARWLKHRPGIEVIARDRAGVYSEGARRGAPDAMQVADRFHLLQNLSDALHSAISRHRNALGVAVKAMTAEVVHGDKTKPESRPKEAPTKLDQLRRKRRSDRRSHYAKILDLRANSLSPREIAPKIGMSVRTVERWLAAGGEPEHRRPRAHSVLVGPFKDYLEKRWDEGERRASQLWAEIRLKGFEGSKATIYRWTAVRKLHATSNLQWRAPSRRDCARLLMGELTLLDEQTKRFLHHLQEVAPELSDAARLARRFVAVIRGQDDASLQQWIEDASNSELAALAGGIARDISAVRAAIKQPWSTSPVEGHINRLKTIKRQMYGRSGFALLRNRVLATD